MKKFFAAFTHNWGLKLLALVLAVVTYYSIKDSIRSPQTSNNFLKGNADGR